jgi:hypothetical protein
MVSERNSSHHPNKLRRQQVRQRGHKKSNTLLIHCLSEEGIKIILPDGNKQSVMHCEAGYSLNDVMTTVIISVEG